MKRVVSVLLVVVFCMTLLLPCAVNGAEEYIKFGKSTYQSGEYMEIVYKFEDADPTRWICIYKGGTDTAHMVAVIPATVLSISGFYFPIVGVGVNGHQHTNPLEPGNYTMKVMHIPEGGNYMDPANFSTGDKSDITNTFTITANSTTTPTLSIADKQIEKNGNLKVAYSGITCVLGNRSLNLVVQNQSGKTVKTRALLNSNYYAGVSGETTISLSGLEPGTYKVGFVCSDTAFNISQPPVEITVTNESVAGTDKVFPEDIFKNKDICGQYFANADKDGVKFDTVDGEYVMTVPHHMGFDYLYTWEPIPYETFTVYFDFLLHIAEEYDSQIADEMDFLFGVSADGKTHHQLTMGNQSGALSVGHWKRENAESPYVPFSDDSYFYDLYEEEMWYTIAVQFTKEDVTVFLENEEILTLTDTANCVGENGRIGLRGGSQGGWKIKNLKVAEGLFEATPDATDAPATQTPAATNTPAPATQSPAPTEATKGSGSGNYAWIIIVVVAVVVAACAVGTILLILKKKK